MADLPRRATRAELLRAWLVIAAVLILALNLIAGLLNVIGSRWTEAGLSFTAALVLVVVVARVDG